MGGPAVFSNACEQGAGCDEVKSLFIRTCLIWGRKTCQNKLLECHKGVLPLIDAASAAQLL